MGGTFSTIYNEHVKAINLRKANHTKHIYTKCSFTDCRRRWYIYLPLGIKSVKNYIKTANQKMTAQVI